MARERARIAAERAALEGEREELDRLRREVQRLADETDLREAVLRRAGGIEAIEPGHIDDDAFGEPPETASAAVPFYEELDESGTWMESDQYGPVWQPDVVAEDPDWAPFTNGSWVWTDYGWAWDDVDPWGDLTAQYGRWADVTGYGWIWVPGTDWAPAWVSWRESDDCIGWAPLPPDCHWRSTTGIGHWVDTVCNLGPDLYCFVSRRDFTAGNCRRHLLPRRDCPELFARSRNVTRLVEAGNRCARSEGGPRRDRLDMSAIAKTRKVEFISSRDSRKTGGDAFAARRIQPTAASSVRPPRAEQRVSTASVNRGWNRVTDRDTVIRLRRHALSDATDAVAGRSARRTAKGQEAGDSAESGFRTDPGQRAATRPQAGTAQPSGLPLAGRSSQDNPTPEVSLRSSNSPSRSESPRWEELREAALVARRAAVERLRREGAQRAPTPAGTPHPAAPATPVASAHTGGAPAQATSTSLPAGRADRQTADPDSGQRIAGRTSPQDAFSGTRNGWRTEAVRPPDRRTPPPVSVRERESAAENARRVYAETVARQRQAAAEAAENLRRAHEERAAREREEAARRQREQKAAEEARRRAEEQRHRQEQAAAAAAAQAEARRQREAAESARRHQQEEAVRRQRGQHQNSSSPQRRGGRR